MEVLCGPAVELAGILRLVDSAKRLASLCIYPIFPL
jgi:hypothetical protein